MDIHTFVKKSVKFNKNTFKSHGRSTMARIAISLAAIFLLSQVALGQTQRDEPNIPPVPNEPNIPTIPIAPSLEAQGREPLDTSSPRLDSLLKECRGNRNSPVRGFLHCNGEPATRLFQMFGNPPFNIPAIEKTYNGRRYLERWLKSPDREINCWERVEVSGDPVVIAFYDCILL